MAVRRPVLIKSELDWMILGTLASHDALRVQL